MALDKKKKGPDDGLLTKPKLVTWKNYILYVLCKTVFCNIKFEYNTPGMSNLTIAVYPNPCFLLHQFL